MKKLLVLVALLGCSGSPNPGARTPSPSPSPSPESGAREPGAPAPEARSPETDVRDAEAPAVPIDQETLTAILNHEAERDLSDGYLLDTAKSHASTEARHLAIRALGRIGGAQAIQALRRILDRDADRFAAVEALAFANATEAADDVASAYKRVASLEDIMTAVRALGRIGEGPRARQMLLDAMKKKDANVRAEAAFALGYWTTRKLAFDAGIDEALIALLSDADPLPRFAAAWALGRRAGEPLKQAVAPLTKLLDDADAEVRAMAIKALGKQSPPPEVFSKALSDADWRVRVEAVRAIPDTANADLKSAVVEQIRKNPNAHVALEASARFKTHLLEVIDKSSYANDALRCADAAARVRAGGAIEPVLKCRKGKDYPEFKPRELAAQLIAEGHGGKGAAKLLATLLKDKDARVRAAAVTAAAKSDPKAAVAAIDDKDLFVVATALEAILASRPEEGDPAPGATVAALKRANKEDLEDPEVLLTFLDFFAAAKATEAQPIVDKALAHPNRTVRQKAAEAYKALTGKDAPEAKTVAKNPLPPSDPFLVLDRPVHWRVTTTQGVFVIEMDTRAAPWTIAALSILAQTGFYNGTLWHRVVPDFVTQGGDPSGSGWGGPGFQLPAEQTFTPYVRGSVGIADAGLDTGGSQWFVTHTRTPHLDGRYTRIGVVTDGMDVVERLVVGDKIVKIDALLE